METTGIRQGMCVKHSDVMDTVFQSGVACDLSVEVFEVLRSE